MRYRLIRTLFDCSVSEDFHSKFVNPRVPATMQLGWASHVRRVFTMDMEREWPLFLSLYAHASLEDIQLELRDVLNSIIHPLPPLFWDAESEAA